MYWQRRWITHFQLCKRSSSGEGFIQNEQIFLTYSWSWTWHEFLFIIFDRNMTRCQCTTKRLFHDDNYVRSCFEFSILRKCLKMFCNIPNRVIVEELSERLYDKQTRFLLIKSMLNLVRNGNFTFIVNFQGE